MNRGTWTVETCSIAMSLDAIGLRSSFLILREALFGTTRFDDFVRYTRGAAPNVAARLRHLTELGLFTKHPYRDEGQRTRDEYLLTEKGKDLLPALFALQQWGDKHLQPDGHEPVRLVERATGDPVRVVARGTSNADLRLDDIAIVAE
ncbi:helix-turn-helix transcriptional regulator [Actinoplanes sp. TBRC 11911]|uniref:winged helix-turn-helix transcriptional regulator n=1 Tax=Actinoplanes sp. TBRC 11911 TaxID=2729386 RepID=UPI00145E1CBC|nr:helix-turn-helix domain-containing protein [Actinoplanes sp. TBRC 11911]NMO49949.1 helix-turn-helix transcriptional regulator [Actinoplanes sp. TBRC 11911]